LFNPQGKDHKKENNQPLPIIGFKRKYSDMETVRNLSTKEGMEDFESGI
jgi:hypothetical protein